MIGLAAPSNDIGVRTLSRVSTPSPARSGGTKRSHLSTATRVSGSQILLAGSGYVALAMSGQLLDAASFAAVTSFYLLLNTVGRGLCAAIELHLTRALAHDLSQGRQSRAARRAGLRQTAVLLGLAVLVVAVASPIITKVLGGNVLLTALLAASMPGMAYAYFQRGLLAGARQYGRYALSFATEGVAALVVAVVLTGFTTDGTDWWVLPFVLSPLVAVGVVRLAAGRHAPAEGPANARTAASGFADLGWSVVLQACSQGVWNLAPVVLTWRLTEAPEIAAGFTSMALVLRIPILFFPAAQALLLPVLTSSSASARAVVTKLWPKLLASSVVLVALWLVAAALVVPTLVRVVFGQDALPSTVTVLILAGASILGGSAQLLQTVLIAAGGYRRVALGWAVALGVLLLIGTLASTSSLVAATSLGAAAVTAVLFFLPIRNRNMNAKVVD